MGYINVPISTSKMLILLVLKVNNYLFSKSRKFLRRSLKQEAMIKPNIESDQ